MANIQDDSEDSRTLLAGRKRGFEEASQDQEATYDGPNNKRARENSSYEPADTSNTETVPDLVSPLEPLENVGAGKVAHFVGITSTSDGDPKAEAEKPVTPVAPTMQAESHATQTVAADVFRDNLIETETSSPPRDKAQIATLPTTKPSWNNVQKGLRTSFASKKSRPNPVAVLSEPDNDSPEAEVALDPHVEMDMGEDAGPSAGQSPSLSNNDDSGILSTSLDTEEQSANPVSESRQKRRRGKKSKAAGEEPVVPVVPPPFKKLKAKQILELSPEARSAYKQAKRLHDANDPEKKRRKEERDELERQRKDAKLQAAVEAGLAKPKQDLNVQQAKAKALTDAAAKVLEEHGWPLPKAHKETADLIYKGLTYYPRKFDRSCTYSKGGVAFVMTPTLDSQGLPIRFPDVSFNEFATKLLIVYSKHWPTLAGDSLAKAFGIYVNFFYTNHYSDDGSWRKRIKDMTSADNNAFTLSEAIAEATRRISSSSADSTQPQPTRNDLKVDSSDDDDVIMIEDDEASESGEVSRSSTSSGGEIINVDLNEAQLLLQRKYFQSADGTTTATGICSACSRLGHDSAHCPALLCTSCGEKHSTFRCPDRQRCSKCRERGHSKEECPEKLGVPKSELQCEFCDSKEHLETECHRIWRSFDPKPEEIRTVRDIPIDCYCCGASNHFGPDCGLRITRLLTGGLTWSKSNLDRYVDPSSSRRAVSAGIDYSITAKKSFSIKGKANDPITFDDSSDDGEGFIRPKIQTAERGHIRFSERQENRPMHSLPRRPVSPVAPYRNSYDGGFSNGEEPRYGMSSDRYYDDAPHNGSLGFHSGASQGGDRSRNNAKPPRRSESGGSRGRASKSGGPKGGRGRGRGR